MKSTQDPCQDVRGQSRFCFHLYHQLFPSHSAVLLMKGMSSTQIRRQIIREFDLDAAAIAKQVKEYEEKHLKEDGAGGSTGGGAEKMKLILAVYDGADTPEQFMRFQKRTYGQEEKAHTSKHGERSTINARACGSLPSEFQSGK